MSQDANANLALSSDCYYSNNPVGHNQAIMLNQDGEWGDDDLHFHLQRISLLRSDKINILHIL